MTRVIQEHESGCGIAVLAMLLGRDYLTIAKDFIGVSKTGIYDTAMFEYLIKNGYALQTKHKRTRLRWPNDERAGRLVKPWPPAPWADKHFARVRTGKAVFHYVAVLKDGSVLDPSPVAVKLKQLTDYLDCASITGLFKVGENK